MSNEQDQGTVNHVQDDEIGKRADNRGQRAQTDLEQMQGYETQGLAQASLNTTPPQPARPDPRDKGPEKAAADKAAAEKAAADKAAADKAAAEKASK